MRLFYLQQFLHQHDGEVPIHGACRHGDTDNWGRRQDNWGCRQTTGEADRQLGTQTEGMQTEGGGGRQAGGHKQGGQKQKI